MACLDKKRSFQGSAESGGEGSGRKSPKNSAPPSSGSSTENLAAAAASTSLNEKVTDRSILRFKNSFVSDFSILVAFELQECRLERHLRNLRQQLRHLDFLWLSAVRSVATSAYDSDPAEAYLAAGGDPGRALTLAEVHNTTRMNPFILEFLTNVWQKPLPKTPPRHFHSAKTLLS